MDTHKNNGWMLFLRSLIPSPASLVVSFVITVMIMGLHLFLLSSNQSNLLLPHLTGVTNDQLAEVYMSTIQVRLDNAFANNSFGIILTALVWGVVGWIVYAIVEFIFSTIKEWHSSDTNINMPLKNKVIHHPLQNQVILKLFWRFFIGTLLILLTVSLGPIMTEIFSYDLGLLQSTSPLEMTKFLLLSVGSWIVILHAYVVLFRLLVLRTRVFGEIIY